MRLIDADEFKKQIAGMAIINNYPADKANKMCELIDSQPTAYGLDKVIEELKKRENKYCDRSLLEEQQGNDKQASYYGGKSDALSEAVLIVKRIENNKWG